MNQSDAERKAAKLLRSSETAVGLADFLEAELGAETERRDMAALAALSRPESRTPGLVAMGRVAMLTDLIEFFRKTGGM